MTTTPVPQSNLCPTAEYVGERDGNHVYVQPSKPGYPYRVFVQEPGLAADPYRTSNEYQTTAFSPVFDWACEIYDQRHPRQQATTVICVTAPSEARAEVAAANLRGERVLVDVSGPGAVGLKI